MASWRDFTDMFGTASSLLTPADVVQSPELVCIPSQTIEGEMVLVSSRRADYVLGQMFCHYLKQAGRKFVPSVEFSSFLESTPGAVQLRERVTGELSPSILANKFPDLIYYWKQEGKGMVCLRADKERAEIDQLEVQRQALELMSQVERDKMDAEKKLAEERAQFDREERKRSEWRQQQQQQQQQQYSPPQFAQYAPPPPQAAASTSAPGYHAYAPQYAGYSAQSYPPPTQQQGVVYPPPPGAQQYYPPAAYPQQQQQPPPSQTYFPPPPPSWQPRS
ncbi:hypothetical protein BASA81_003353 [Batrachochytrium salamandrivorans]|nr:hypothetical protein BASA81_003353 [Batrachochytrium salamandrivorans]